MPNTNKKFAVAFSSPKRSAKTIELASAHARAMDAELVLLRIIPDPNKVGVIAQLISTERPIDKAKMQIDEVVERLKQEGVKASGLVKVGEVAKGIVETTKEIGADVLYVGTTSIGGRQFFLMKNDPIVHYLVEHCPVSLFLVRHDLGSEPAVEQGEEEELNQ